MPRATHEGWLREADDHSLSLRPAGPRRGRSLLGRLRQTRRTASERSVEEDGLPAPTSPPIAVEGGAVEDGLYDFLDSPLTPVKPVPAAPHSRSSEPVPAAPHHSIEEPLPTGGEMKMGRALEVFNEGEQPRRLAGVARSLGAPTVRVAPVADSGSVVSLVVAWELCWYRYEVDLGEESTGAQLIAQGMELEELPREDLVANAAIDERGALALLA